MNDILDHAWTVGGKLKELVCGLLFFFYKRGIKS